MDPPSIVKSFKYSSTQQPMFSGVEAPLHYRSSSSPHNNSSLQKLQENYTGCGAIDDTEISIFDAQKYFSENSDPMKKQDLVSIPRLSSVSSVDGYGRNFRTRSFHATPTASSEASWNSQTGLLTGPSGCSLGISLRNFDESKKRSSIARKWIFGRKCCCSGKKSVEIKEAGVTTSASEHNEPAMTDPNENIHIKSNFLHAKGDSYKSKQSPSTMSSITNSFPSPDPPRQQRISASGRPFVDSFSFPVLNNAIPVTKARIFIKHNALEDLPRDSLEVFQPMHDVRVDDDVGSDASSDLFEIESFSTQTTSYPMYRRRDSLEEAPTFNVRRFATTNGLDLDELPTPSVAATECYAPSEVSIDWSVTTAEGFDKASVSNFSLSASEMGSAAFLQQQEGGGKTTKKGLLLMSCRHEKAVTVGPHPVKCVAAAGGRPPKVNKPPLGADHSARLSLAFAA